MKLISWNVNGIRAIYKKGLVKLIETEQPDILCLQETKAHPEQLDPEILNLASLKGYWSAAQRRGYSGVATFLRQDVAQVQTGIGHEEYDSEGRFVVSHHPEFSLYNIYFPNGGSGLERHNFKQRFLAHLVDHLRPLVDQGRPLIVTGDYNIAHREIDIYDPVRLANESGFLPEERQWFSDFLQMGFVDTFRHFHPEKSHCYTWWSYREMGRMGNRGWRIDYICVTRNLLERLTRADILDQVEGSDHCPVIAEFSI